MADPNTTKPEEELSLSLNNLSLKKKKKKKSQPLPSLLSTETDTSNLPTTTPLSNAEDAEKVIEVSSDSKVGGVEKEGGVEEDGDLGMILPAKKKKKKSALKSPTTSTTTSTNGPFDEEVSIDDVGGPVSEDGGPTPSGPYWSGTSEKKSVSIGETSVLNEGVDTKGKSKTIPAIAAVNDAEAPWAGTDRDYEYGEMVARVFARLRANNPELSGVPKKFVMKPPQLSREGKQRSVFVNFQEICKLMRRDPDHLLSFLLAELGTTGSIDGNKRLVLKGRYQAKHIESVLRRYITEYVTCSLCRSPDTRLIKEKETRLHFLLCESCGAKRSVANIKGGYVAQIGRRKKK